MYHIPYSKSSLEFSLSPEMHVTMAESRTVEPVADPGSAVREALVHPIGSPLLRELASPGDRVCIVFTAA